MAADTFVLSLFEKNAFGHQGMVVRVQVEADSD